MITTMPRHPTGEPPPRRGVKAGAERGQNCDGGLVNSLDVHAACHMGVTVFMSFCFASKWGCVRSCPALHISLVFFL